jgi:hypothetical protein
MASGPQKDKNIKVQTVQKDHYSLIRECNQHAQITDQYDSTPPQVWLSSLRRVARDCRGFKVQVEFIAVERVVPLGRNSGMHACDRSLYAALKRMQIHVITHAGQLTPAAPLMQDV